MNGLKNIPGKACVHRVHNKYAIVNVGNWRTRKTPHTNEEEVYRYIGLSSVFSGLKPRGDIKSLHVMYYRPFDRSIGL